MMLCPLVSMAGASNYIYHLDQTAGLSSRYIRNINQDAKGFVWIATIDGLNRFDGRRFDTYTKENSGLPSNQINDIIQDPTNTDRVWIATRNDGVSVFDYNTGTIQHRAEVSHSPDIPSLSPASGNKIWITNYHFPPDLFDPSSGKTERLYYTTPEGMPRAFWCAEESHDGKKLYIGHDGYGFTVVDLKSRKFKNFKHDAHSESSLIGNHVFSIYPDGEGRVWIGTDKGLSIFNPIDQTFRNVMPSDESDGLLEGNIYCIDEMRNGDLWIATDRGGICIIHAADRLNSNLRFERLTGVSPHNPLPSISTSSVNSVFQDSFGNIWIGNQTNGIDVLSYSMPFFMQDALFSQGRMQRSQQSVWSTSCDDSGNVWLGGEDRIMRIGIDESVEYDLPTMSAGYNALVKSILCARSGEIWIGTNNSGVFVFNPDSHSFKSLPIDENSIYQIIEDADGSKLIATKNGIYRCKDGYNAIADERLNILVKDKIVMSMLIDRSGNLWVGTLGAGAVMIAKSGSCLYFDRSKGLPSNSVNALFEDNEGVMWIASREGAASLSPNYSGVERVFTEKDGLISSNIKSIQQDSERNIWFATNMGMARYNKSDGNLSVYQRLNGTDFPSVSENSGSTSTTDGNPYFGTVNGLLKLNPLIPGDFSSQVKLSLNCVVAFDKDADDSNFEIEIPVNNQRISLPYNLNTFNLTFADPDITHASNSEYCHNMIGVNDVWTPASDSNEAAYRDLKPGKYVFQVRHRLNGGEWSDPVVLAHITITPPIYLTWWAKLFYVLVAIIIIGLILLFYKHKLDLEQKLVIEKENNKNSNLLNEERLVFFTNITHELRTPLSLIVGPIEDMVNDKELNQAQRNKLLTIRTSSMRLLNLINGILEFRKTETRNRKLEVIQGNLSNYVREIGLRYKELNNNPKTSIIIDMPDDDEIFAYYDPEVISTVVNNLMSNAMKYTPEGEIRLCLKIEENLGVKYIKLSVSDTGVGIPAEDLPHVFERYYQAHHNKKISGTGIGLALTKNLVELHEGEISVDSAPGEGSEFTVRFVLQNSYPSAKHREVDAAMVSDSDTTPAVKIQEQPLSLMIVEDDPDVREYIVQSLGDEFKIYEASNGVEGLKIVRDNMPDLVVSDIMMPEMDGIELCSAIKADFMTSHIPVILLTAKDSLLDKEAGYASGADSYITKPFSSNLLKARINNIIESRHKLTIRLLDNEHPVIADSVDDDNEEKENCGYEEKLTQLDRDFIAKFKGLVEDNLEVADLDVPFMADKMCMSHSTLYRKVKGITGMTPNEFIKKIKLAKACELLKSGKVSVSDISYAIGFSNPAYFRRVFKAEYGVSPTQFLSDQTINI